VKNGTRYPAVMLTTGCNDLRLEGWESAKMTARLQVANSSGKPISVARGLQSWLAAMPRSGPALLNPPLGHSGNALLSSHTAIFSLSTLVEHNR
jgi:hypothetical protein